MSSNKLTPLTIWLTGLSASGKTTLAKRLKSDLEKAGIYNVELLDGEELRERIRDNNFSTEDRNSVGLVKAKLALEFNKKGVAAIVTGIAHHRETREKIREILGGYVEVFLRCPVEVCAKRDYKGNYRKAFDGNLQNFVGVTEPYQESNNTELTIETASKTINECAKILFDYVTREFINEVNSG